MKKLIRFSKFFIPAAIISVLLVIFGIAGYIYNDGFALGVDFQAGLIQEVQIAPAAFNLVWNGTASAEIRFSRSLGYIEIIILGSGIDNRTFTFPYNEYTTIGSLKIAMEEQIEDIVMNISADENINTQWLIYSSLGNRLLSDEVPYIVHYIEPQSPSVDISEVRAAMSGFAHSVSVQNLGTPSDRQFMIRVEDQEEGRVTSVEIVQTLEEHFGKGSIAVLRSDYVGSRFSKDLTDQAGVLIFLTLLLVLIYSAIRFRLQFAVGAVIAIMYDVLVIIAFVVWTRMEFTTLSIAAILTILGYSTNNTIILFDRIRENLRINQDTPFVDILDISLTAILGRTIITTLSTMLAVVALFVFTTGAMKDFALALLVGMTSGVFTTLFIVSGFINFWENQKNKREKKKKLAAK